MKAITIWQPWASLLACGAKKYETRSWVTSYRGPIAIHAAARKCDIGNLSGAAHVAIMQAITEIEREIGDG
ncbi:MAG: ASCH domain-containing protein [Oscillospiraceae bacterium]